MLEKTVAAIKADKAKTLDLINKGENGFLVSDLYPFCFNLRHFVEAFASAGAANHA